MFAHQVIDDLDHSICYDHTKTKIISSSIKMSQSFHFGEANELVRLVGAKSGKTHIFYGDQRRDINPPFNRCWFDFTSSIHGSRFSKLGFLIMDSLFKEHVISIVCFEFQKKYNTWLVWPVIWDVPLADNDSPVTSRGMLNVYKRRSYQDIEAITDEGIQLLAVANFALMILNCKNISTEKQYPSKAINKKRLQRHRQPIFTYHTLVLTPVGKKQKSIPRHLWENRIHLCRGHFKTYTQDNPLFGRITGRFWWQPAVRGRNRNGIVMKDYQFESQQP